MIHRLHKLERSLINSHSRLCYLAVSQFDYLQQLAPGNYLVKFLKPLPIQFHLQSPAAHLPVLELPPQP